MANTTCSKTYHELPFAHRQPEHKGHCRLLHGHNWSFVFTFRARELESNGFVVDFGKLKFVGEWLEERFDHTLVLNAADPALPMFQAMGLAKVVVVPNCGSEGLAAYLLTEVNRLLMARPELSDRGVTITSVTVHEDSNNKATVSL